MRVPSLGRVYRRCGCRDEQGKQLGPRCPRLGRSHGRWTFEAEMPPYGGKRRRVVRSGFTTRTEAMQAFEQLKSGFVDGVHPDASTRLRDHAEAWIVEVSQRLKPKTIDQYRRYLRADILPALGALPLQDITHADVKGFHDQLARAGRGVTTRHRIHATLCSLLKAAVRQRLITSSPAEHVVLPPERPQRPQLWTPEQMRTFLESIAGHRMEHAFHVLAYTGLRRGELVALRWSDIDLRQHLLHVRRSVSHAGGTLAFTDPKTTASAAPIGLSPACIGAFERQQQRQRAERLVAGDGYEDHNLVFAREDGSPYRPDQLGVDFRRAVAAADLPRIRVHDLRHLAATLMLSQGVPLSVVSKHMRHSSVSVTVDLYGHLVPEVARQAASTLEDAITSPSQPTGKEVTEETNQGSDMQKPPAHWGSRGECARKDSNPQPSDP